MADIKLIVGLGNPGRRYSGTRHNAGFEAVERVAAGFDAAWKSWQGGLAEIALHGHGDGRLIAAKPMGFMNNSGESVSALLSYYKIQPPEMLVLSDDFAIPLGALRLRRSGSDGGHNGLESIIRHTGTDDFPRLRIGIGPMPQRTDPSEFVLSKFDSSENISVEKMLESAAECVGLLLSRGWEKALLHIAQNNRSLEPAE
jgi:peptidyl-tRNA hydrolase, PTH1 family